jgi:hypothetical protein
MTEGAVVVCKQAARIPKNMLPLITHFLEVKPPSRLVSAVRENFKAINCQQAVGADTPIGHRGGFRAYMALCLVPGRQLREVRRIPLRVANQRRRRRSRLEGVEVRLRPASNDQTNDRLRRFTGSEHLVSVAASIWAKHLRRCMDASGG